MPKKSLPTDERIQRFLTNIDKYQRDGFQQFYSLNEFPQDDSMWEFRISLYPDSENLKKAAKLLTPVFATENLNFKFLILKDDSRVEDIAWDGTQTNGANSDRDQRGKECCVYIRFPEHSAVAEKTSAEIKAMMLKAWKILQENDIKFNYMAPPYGDRAISVEGHLVSPFSYAANRPWKGEHGIMIADNYCQEASELLSLGSAKYEGYLDLSKSNPNPSSLPKIAELPTHNPLRFTDPFADIEFTHKDMIKAGINIGHVLQEQFERCSYLMTHYNSAYLKNEEYLQQIASEAHDKEPILEQLDRWTQGLDQVSDEEKKTYIKDNRKQLEWICAHWPHQSDSAFSEAYGPIDEIRHYLERDLIIEISGCIDKFDREGANTQINKIKEDFARFLPDLNLNDLDLLIEKDPARMQVLFRRLIHTKHESEALVLEQEKVHQHEILFPLHEAITDLRLTNHKNLRNQLIKLQGELYQKMITGANKADISTLAFEAKNMVEGIMSNKSKEEKIACVEHFEQHARSLKSFEKSTWQKVGKAVACVVIAAVGAIIGAVIGAAIEAGILALISAPTGGIGGVFGALDGAIHGSLTGWTLGIMASSAIGLAGGLGVGLRFLGRKDGLDNIVQTAKESIGEPSLKLN
ncbi:glycine zipper family protein [Legionella saoudiensis]|uniref:glycine zipper family protein n=1 Tax=Legionella saoudiensis TaxID=1750561 RepID=UPI0007308364|nr:glycine zipper family protein [Legionella saoudiensis]